MACKTCTGNSGCGCSNCHCNETDICKSNEELSTSIHDKLALLKDYVCVLGASTCQSIIKAVAKYAFFIWCFLRDLTNIVLMHDKRLDCLEDRIDELIEYIRNQAADNVAFGMKSKGSTGEQGLSSTYTKIDTTKDGSFVINWNMVDSGEIGKGRVEGKVNHTYTVEKDGSIKTEIKSFTLTKASYTLSGGSTDNVLDASFSVLDKSGRELWKRNYKVTQAWSETINKTFDIKETRTIKPNGGSTGDINVFKTWDDWTSNDTRGDVSISYTNNAAPFTLNSEPCGRCPEDKVEEKKEGDANA